MKNWSAVVLLSPRRWRWRNPRVIQGIEPPPAAPKPTEAPRAQPVSALRAGAGILRATSRRPRCTRPPTRRSRVRSRGGADAVRADRPVPHADRRRGQPQHFRVGIHLGGFRQDSLVVAGNGSAQGRLQLAVSPAI